MFFVPVLKRSHFRMSIQETERFKNDAFQNVPQFPKVFLLISVFYVFNEGKHASKKSERFRRRTKMDVVIDGGQECATCNNIS